MTDQLTDRAARAYYEAIPPESPLYFLAEMLKARDAQIASLEKQLAELLAYEPQVPE